MKIQTKKFVLGALLTTCSLAIVSSITSTFAWYSYNTKNGLAFSGIASGKTENLQVRLVGEDDTQWRTSLTKDELTTYSTNKGFAGSSLAPVSQAKGIGKKTTLPSSTDNYGFYGAPSYLIPKSNQNSIKDDSGNYVFFKASYQFRCVNPLDTTKFYAKKIYISFMEVKVSDNTATQDITKGLRVHINQGTSNYLIAPGYADDVTTDLTGKLNLAGSTEEGAVDKGIRTSGEAGSVDATYRRYIEGYDDPDDLESVVYGNVAGAQELAYGTKNVVTKFTDGKVSDGKILIGETLDTGVAITVNMVMWLEGWDPVVINKNYKAEFDFGIQFECEVL